MDKDAFRKAREKLSQGRPFSDPVKLRAILSALRDAAAPEHVGEYVSIGLVDRVKCSCGWESKDYLDGAEFAWNKWHKHVAETMGLNTKTYPCGKTYVPADGESAYNELLKSILKPLDR